VRFEDPAADFIPAVERVFGTSPRVLEHRLGMVEVDLDIEAALQEAKAKLDELG
jgi:hypothetical protein